MKRTTFEEWLHPFPVPPGQYDSVPTSQAAAAAAVEDMETDPDNRTSWRPVIKALKLKEITEGWPK